jgi:leucyl aminopeptidase
MEEMTMDMTGGATALMILKCASDIDLKKNIIVLVPAVENAISGSAYRPGDIIKSMEGITVEIGNTDAEGRLVMADTITYSKKYNPRLLIDVATLTGASLVALGEKASVLMTSDASLEKIIREAGEKTGEYVWPLPVWDEYEADIKSKFADILNTSNTGRYGGAITAGMFVREFASKLNDCRHAHLDIAPRMTSVKGDNLTQGATGEPVRMLLEVLKEL